MNPPSIPPLADIIRFSRLNYRQGGRVLMNFSCLMNEAFLASAQRKCPSGFESFHVHFYDVVAFGFENGFNAFDDDFLVNGNKWRGGAQHHHVGCPGIAGFFGNLVGIDADDVYFFAEFIKGVFQLRIVGDVYEFCRVGYQASLRRKVGQVAQRFHGFHRQDEVGMACGNQVGPNGVVGNAQVRHYGASALAHAVRFGLFQVIVFVKGGSAQ